MFAPSLLSSLLSSCRLLLLAFLLVPGLLCPANGQVASGTAGREVAGSSEKSAEQPTLRLNQFSAGRPLRMLAYGDMRFTDPAVTKGTNPKVRKWLAEKVGLERPEALIITGDMPFVGDKPEDWAEYQTETSSWKAAGFPVLPTIGNHEIFHDRDKGIVNYLNNYPLVEGHRWYSALLGSVEVISLDMSSPVGPRSEQGCLVCHPARPSAWIGRVSFHPLPCALGCGYSDAINGRNSHQGCADSAWHAGGAD